MDMPQHSDKELSFFDESRVIAEKFIQTVVAVDDQISFGENQVLDVLDEIIDPSQSQSALGEIGRDEGLEGADEEFNDNYVSDLDYQELSKCFAEKSILCSALKTFSGENGEELTIDATVKLAKRADITILDWQMESEYSNYGNIASESVKRLLKYDVENNGRLRLILIYTSEEIAKVLEKLSEQLDMFKAIRDDGSGIDFKGDNLQLCKIVVINKQENIESLVNTSIREFARMTCGLLSNAVLAAITEIRDRTHHYLYKFNKNLDTAYISHILSLISSTDMRESSHEVAFDYAVDLISEEFKSNLQISQAVKDSLSGEKLKKWPLHVNEENEEIHCFNHPSPEAFKCNNERMEKFLTVTDEGQLREILNEIPKYPGGLKKFSGKNIQFQLGSCDSNDAHLELSAIECLRRDMLNVSGVTPVLKLGTVISRDNCYYVCIQPLCDSVRLTAATNFLFLKADKIGADKFTHVVRKAIDSYEKIMFKAASKLVCLMTFEPNDKMVRAVKENEKFFFESDNGEKFEWFGEFKQAAAQKIVNDVSANISRVGIDSFEWLRLRNS